MKTKLFFIALITLVGCAIFKPEFKHPDKPVQIFFTKTDSLYSIAVYNRIDNLSLEQLENNVISLIEAQKDSSTLNYMLNSYSDFFKEDYSVLRYKRLNQKLNGTYVMYGAEMADTTITLKDNYRFLLPNLLVVPYDSSVIYFSIGEKIAGTYNDNVVYLKRKE